MHRLALPLALFLASCATNRELLPYTETVLSPGMTVTAEHPRGDIQITAGQGTQRVFSGVGWEKRRNLIPRKARWYGSLGLYDPASSFSPYGRLLADEGRLFFDNESEALQYLDAEARFFHPIHTSNGLVVGYHISTFPDGGEPVRDIQLWQIYIAGKRPLNLPGANDEAIKVMGGTIPDTASPYPAPIGYVKTLRQKEADQSGPANAAAPRR